MATEDELRDQIMNRAASDSDFRDLLKSDPHAAISDATGVEMPAELKIVVVEDSADTVHVVLPAPGAGTQLSDQELEQVAGGASDCEGAPHSCGAVSLGGWTC